MLASLHLSVGPMLHKTRGASYDHDLHRAGLALGEPFVASFKGRCRDELLNIEEFGTLLEARVIVEAWRAKYNTYRPHSSLGGLTPAELAKRWTTNQPALDSWTTQRSPVSSRPADRRTSAQGSDVCPDLRG